VFVGAGALLVALAFVVGRANVRGPGGAPYVGVRGASRAKAAGLEILYVRGAEQKVVEPSTVLRAGDRLRFRVRGERSRYVEVRLRDGAADPMVVFPAFAGVGSGPIAPKEVLPIAHELTANTGRVIVTALFSDHPRTPGAPPDADTDVVTLTIAKE